MKGKSRMSPFSGQGAQAVGVLGFLEGEGGGRVASLGIGCGGYTMFMGRVFR